MLAILRILVLDFLNSPESGTVQTVLPPAGLPKDGREFRDEGDISERHPAGR